jgi:hypothetical protein
MVLCFRCNGKKRYGTSSSRERHGYARRPSSNTAIVTFACDAELGAGNQPHDGCQVVEAVDGRGFKDRAEGSSLHDLGPSRGGSGRRIPASHITAVRRSPCVRGIASGWHWACSLVRRLRAIRRARCSLRSCSRPKSFGLVLTMTVVSLVFPRLVAGIVFTTASGAVGRAALRVD